jgi:DNA (cytosine-5)-methyltransferase 1
MNKSKQILKRKKLRAVSLFSGCGGFDWGATKAGVKIIWANDIDPHAEAAYRKIFPDVNFVSGDITNIKKFPKADVLIGCYPCTGFSEGSRRRFKHGNKIRKRNLFANDGNFLYREFLRALKQVNPKYLFVENVKGMLTAEEGWFLKQQLRGFRRHGYRVKFQLLNASNFGVPQSRKRVFIVGIRKNVKYKYDFPAPTHGIKGKLPFVVLRDAIGRMKKNPKGEFSKKDFHGHYLTRNRKRDWDQTSYTIVAHTDHVPLHPMGKPMKAAGKDKYKLQGKVNRRLSWRECAVIQGLPKRAIPTGTLIDKHRVIGNAVPPAFGKVLLEPIVRFESERFLKKSKNKSRRFVY